MKPFFALFLFLPISGFAQGNLVLNPSFEEFKPGKQYSPCTYGSSNTAFSQVLTNWTTFLESTPDLVVWNDSCFSPKPHSGQNEVGIITYLPAIDIGKNEDYHEFIQAKLSSPLQIGKEYSFSCYIQLGRLVGERHIRQLYHMFKNMEVLPVAAGGLGVYFSEVEEKYMTVDVATPQLIWYEPIVTKQGEWLQISKTFKATRPYQYFTIGNFYSDNDTATDLKNTEEVQNHNLETNNISLKKRRIGYYLFDDFWLGEGPPPAPVPSISEELKKSKTYTFRNVNFESGKADLLAGAMPELDGLLDFLKANPGVSVEIGGHTDNVGNDEANRLLSEKRASAVASYLISKGVNASRVVAKGFGESKPIASNTTAAGRLQNRRVECKIL
jgi:outer membrane protein OmpA-like peptidoglycan-associated protein